jgi:hypothetical protein
VEGIINSIIQFLQQGIAAIFHFLELIWTWSFGQIVAIFSSDWQALPIWKIVVLIVALAAIAYILYRAVGAMGGRGGIPRLCRAAQRVHPVLPQIVIVGLCLGAGYVIQHQFSVSWGLFLPNLRRAMFGTSCADIPAQ